MENPWAYALIALALVALAVSWNIPRARLWLAIGAISFFVSSIYWDLGERAYHPVITLACDALVCACVNRFAREKWELGIFLAFMTSVAGSLLYLAGFIPRGWIYAALLEFCNLLAILWISGVGILDALGRRENSIFHHIRADLHSAYRPVR